jgi:hypothetical protein
VVHTDEGRFWTVLVRVVVVARKKQHHGSGEDANDQ